ncbi:hypothetical protein D3C87_1127700 [compost metagenome]
MAAGRIQVGVGAGARTPHAVGQRVVLDLVGQVIVEIRQARAAGVRLPGDAHFLVGGGLGRQRRLDRQQFVGIGQAEAASDLAIEAETGRQVLTHAQLPGGQVVAAVRGGARARNHVQVVRRVLAAHAHRHVRAVRGADLALGEHAVLMLARLPLGRFEVVVGVLVGRRLCFLCVGAEDEAVAAVDGQAVAHAADVLFQLLVAQDVAEAVVGQAVQLLFAGGQVGVQGAGADRLLQLQAERGGRGLDVVDVVLRSTRVVLELVQARGGVDRARTGQFQLLRGRAAIQADRAVAVAEREAGSAAFAALAAIVAVAVGMQRLHVGVDAHLFVVHGDGGVVLAQAIAAEGGGGAGGHRFLREIRPGDDVDDAAGGAAAVLHGSAAAHDLDAFHLVQRHHAQAGRRQVVGVLLYAVDQDQRIAGAGDAEAAQVDDGVVAGTGGVDQVDAGLRRQQVLHGAGAAGRDVLGGDDRDGHRQRAAIRRHALGGDGDAVEFRGSGGGLLGGGDGRSGTEQGAGVTPDGAGFHLHNLDATRDPAGHSRWGGCPGPRPARRAGAHTGILAIELAGIGLPRAHCAHGDRCGGSTGWTRGLPGRFGRRGGPGGRLPVSRLPFARGRQVLCSCQPVAPKAPVRGRNCITVRRGKASFVTIRSCFFSVFRFFATFALPWPTHCRT